MTTAPPTFQELLRTVRELAVEVADLRERAERLCVQTAPERLAAVAAEVAAEEAARVETSLLAGVDAAVATALAAETDLNQAVAAFAELAQTEETTPMSLTGTWPSHPSRPTQPQRDSHSELELTPVAKQQQRIAAREQLCGAVRAELLAEARAMVEATPEGHEETREMLLRVVRDAGKETERAESEALRRTDAAIDEQRAAAAAFTTAMRREAARHLGAESAMLLRGMGRAGAAELLRREELPETSATHTAFARDVARDEAKSLIAKALATV